MTTASGQEQPPEIDDSTYLLRDDGRLTHRTPQREIRPLLIRAGSSFLEPFADDTGSARNVRSGLLTLTFFGSVLGLLMPKNDALPTHWYRVLSSMVGYTYFSMWSISFYPQIVLNYRRGSTEGLSNDFSAVNLVGYVCYTTYTTAFYFNGAIQGMYRDRYGADATPSVASNDVAFAVHALALASVWVGQIAYYGKFKVTLSRFMRYAIGGIVTLCVSLALLIHYGAIGGITWIDYLYVLSAVKVFITITKYVPQVALNRRRKSTVGWNIWNVCLDFMGGMLSLMQLVMDSIDMNDWSGITGNLAKFGLSLVTIFFDVVFLVQHYILYRHPQQLGKVNNETQM